MESFVGRCHKFDIMIHRCNAVKSFNLNSIPIKSSALNSYQSSSILIKIIHSLVFSKSYLYICIIIIQT